MRKHPSGSYERLYQDYQRMQLVYGCAILVLTITIALLVWIIPNFSFFPSRSQPSSSLMYPNMLEGSSLHALKVATSSTSVP